MPEPPRGRRHSEDRNPALSVNPLNDFDNSLPFTGARVNWKIRGRWSWSLARCFSEEVDQGVRTDVFQPNLAGSDHVCLPMPLGPLSIFGLDEVYQPRVRLEAVTQPALRRGRFEQADVTLRQVEVLVHQATQCLPDCDQGLVASELNHQAVELGNASCG